jgi:hypothetical protein
MTLDDEARRVAHTTRTETGSLPIPEVDELRPMPRSRVRPALVATACVVVVALIAGAIALTRSGSSKPVKTIEHPGTWERIPASVAGFRDGDSVGVIVRGGPGFVAVGAHSDPAVPPQVLIGNISAAAWVSVDGRQWQRASIPPDAPGLSYLVSTPHGFYAVGTSIGPGPQQTTVVHSDDGHVWSIVDTNAPTGIIGVAAGGPGIVAVGSHFTSSGPRAVIWSSADGRTWTPAPGDESLFPPGMVTGVASRPGILVAVGAGSRVARGRRPDALVWTSTDAVHWTLHHDALGNGYPQALAAHDSGFVIWGATYMPTTGPSSSSTTTTTTPGGSITQHTPGCPYTSTMTAIDAVAAGKAVPTTWVSTDGVNWRPRRSAPNPLGFSHSVAFTNGWWVAGGSALDLGFKPDSPDLRAAAAWLSADDVTWVRGFTEPAPPPGRCETFSRQGRAVAPTATGAVVAVDTWGLPFGPDVMPAPDIWLWTAPK